MIADKLAQVNERIASACAAAGRPVQSVTLLAVSKTFGVEAIAEAHAAGQRRFGENYVQEAVEKIAALAALEPRPEWHLIGPLQSNKTRVVAERFDWVHSVDRLKIAERLSAQRPARLAPLSVCLQVNISGEASKSGLAPAEVPALARAVAALPRLRLRGLMAIPEVGADPRGAAPAASGPARAVRGPAPRRPRARHAVDGHERRPGSGDPRRGDDGPGRHGDLRRPPGCGLSPTHRPALRARRHGSRDGVACASPRAIPRATGRCAHGPCRAARRPTARRRRAPASTTSRGFGSGVSIADACGWISSGQRGSQSQRALPHSLQKRRSAFERVARLPGSRITA